MHDAHAHQHCDDPDCHHDHSRGSRRIYIYSPAGAVRDKKAFRRAVARLKALGHEVEIDPSALDSHQRFAGDDEARLAAIARACASGADVALISRGGYGLTRLLHRIDYDAIAQAIAGGMRWVGYSDFTALQQALVAKTGAVTWAGPALVEDFGSEDESDDIMLDCFQDLLAGSGEGVGWRLPKGDEPADGEIYVPEAQLWGGNLAMVASLLGTPYLPSVDGGILFLEDVAEPPYRTERMLTSLLHAGVLQKQQAIVLGQFSNYKLTPHDKGFKLASVVQWVREQAQVPVFTNLPFGHVPTKVLLPVGAKVSLSVEGRDALIYWGHA
ncbi:LD-carboxypeptidase [Comamonas humi]